MIWSMVSDSLAKFAQSCLDIALPILVTAAIGGVIVQAKIAWSNFKQSQPTVADWLEKAASFAVPAAEQAGIGAKLKGLAFDKKDYAIEIGQKWLEAYGVNVDLSLIEAANEKAVAQLFPHTAVTQPSTTPSLPVQ